MRVHSSLLSLSGHHLTDYELHLEATAIFRLQGGEGDTLLCKLYTKYVRS